MHSSDVWWAVRDEASARIAYDEVTVVLGAKGLPFFDSLTTNKEILKLFDAGQVLGFEIDRDEVRLLLLAEEGIKAELRHRLCEYEARWPLSPATERASRFLREFRGAYGFSAEQ
jgi:hypothetical protein